MLTQHCGRGVCESSSSGAVAAGSGGHAQMCWSSTCAHSIMRAKACLVRGLCGCRLKMGAACLK
eukprot:1159438-Pelagomonas_calceolata.AAC.1